MAAYIVRRHREFDKLKELSAQAEVSDDIKANLLLKFSGLSMQQRSQVVASCNNQYNLKLIESALCTQFPTIHGSDSSANSQKGKKGTKGYNRYRSKSGAPTYGVWAADTGAEDYLEYDYEHNDHPDGNYDSYNTNTYTAEEDYS